MMGLPVSKDFLYPRHSVPEPDDDAELFKPPMAGPDPLHGIPMTPAKAPIVGGTSAPKPQPAKASYAPSLQMILAARQGLALSKEHGSGGALSAITRARDMAQGERITEGTAKRLMIYFDSHPEDATAAQESAGGIAFLLHGGNAGKQWVEQMVKGELKG
jgi:hypothetical protein